MSKARRIPTLSDPREAEAHFTSAIDQSRLATPTVLVVCCDDQARPIHQWHVLGVDPDATPSECGCVLDDLVDRAEHEAPVAGLALGLTRPGSEQVQPYDRTWFRALYRICHQRGLSPFGVYTVTRAGARPLHIDDAA